MNQLPDTVADTVADLALTGLARFGTAPAQRFKRGSQWQQRNYTELAESTREVALGLVALGVNAGDRVCILAETRPEWLDIQLGIAAAGAIAVTIYASNTPDECAWVIGNSGAVLVFCENAMQVAKIESVRTQLPQLRHVLAIDSDSNTLAQLQKMGGDIEEVRTRACAVRPDDPALIVYTSGTTGRPKGCVLTHRNLMSICVASSALNLVHEDDLLYIFLPLAHVMGQIMQIAALGVGAETGYVSNGQASIMTDFSELSPTVFPSAPRIFEKVYAAVTGRLSATQLDAVVRAGLAVADGTASDAVRAIAEQADATVFSQVRTLLGGRLRLAISGSAPIAPAILEFFRAARVPVYEGWGLTESTGLGTLVPADDVRIGTIGTVVPNAELRVADDGELLLRGPMIFKEYWRNPRATEEAFVDGWFRTGDLGSLDDDGFVSITGRKKDIIITSGGKNIAPSLIENDLRQSPWISQAVMFGDRRPYLVALITLDPDHLTKWARDHGLADDVAMLVGHPAVRAVVEEIVAQANGKYARVAQIKRFAILERELTLAAGEITPSLKIKRSVVGAKHVDLINTLYELSG
jgi:long-chain acyl-CoA synthetase